MTWLTITWPTIVHVVPVLEDGSALFHTRAVDCVCQPDVEHHARTLVVHRTAGENRRNVLRAWNLRRMMRGRRGGMV